jgi:hypothetical protein
MMEFDDYFAKYNDNGEPWNYACCHECAYHDRHKVWASDHLSEVYDMLSGKKEMDYKALYMHLEEVATVLNCDKQFDKLITTTKL